MINFQKLIGDVTVRCGTYLNNQDDFDDHHNVWKCADCGHNNSISVDNIYEDYWNGRSSDD